jgi:4,5-DOPA dioxygenase extradiol
MPVGFVGHGNPLNVAMRARAEPWQRWGRTLPRPAAVLAISAHWEDSPVTIGRTRDHDELLYDYWGFPEFMYRLRYPAPGAPSLADRVDALLSPHLPVVRAEDRPIDHGAFVPLIHLLPEADVPVLQISMPMQMSEQQLYELGSELSPLRDEGVFILGTGNLVHDLRHAVLSEDPEPPGYAATTAPSSAGSRSLPIRSSATHRRSTTGRCSSWPGRRGTRRRASPSRASSTARSRAAPCCSPEPTREATRG